MKANRINDILTECNHYQNVSMEIWKRITLTHIDREFSTKVRAICNEGREAIKENYRIVCEQLQFVREHTELDPIYRRDIIEYYDMLLNVVLRVGRQGAESTGEGRYRADGTDPAEGAQ